MTELPRGRLGGMRRWADIWLTLRDFLPILLIAGAASCGYLLLWLAPDSWTAAPAKQMDLLLVDAKYVLPERVDMLIYIYAFVAAVFLAAMLAVLQWRQADALHSLPSILALGCFAVVVFLTELTADFPISALLVLGGVVITAIAIPALSSRYGFRRWPFTGAGHWRYGSYGTFLALSVLSVALTLIFKPFGRDKLIYAFHSAHFEPVLYGTVLPHAGGICIRDFLPQYGCYGAFLAPVLELVGLDVLRFTLVLALLQCVGVVACLWVCHRIFASAQTRLASGMGWALAFSILLHVMLLNVISPVDQYFQYMPVRLAFPALALVLVLGLVSTAGLGSLRAHLGLVALAGGISAAALFWNPDTGVAVSLTLAMASAASGFTGWERKRILQILLGGMTSLCVFAISLTLGWVFGLSLLAGDGGALDPRHMLTHSTTFVRLGFAMLPAPGPIGFWGLGAAAILTVVLMATVRLVSGGAARDPALEIAAIAAVLSSLLLVYYVGRSHLLVFKLASWPLAIVGGFLLMRGIDLARSRSIRIGLVGFAITAATLSISATGPYIGHFDRTTWLVPAQTPPENRLEDEISFILGHARPGEVVDIFALHQGILYAETGTHPATGGVSVTEMYLASAFEDKMQRVLACGPEKLFVGTDLLETQGIIPRIRLDLVRLREVYAHQETSPLGRLELWKRNGPPQWAMDHNRWHRCHERVGLK